MPRRTNAAVIEFRNNVILDLKAQRGQTAKDLGLKPFDLAPLIKSGHVKTVGTRKNLDANGVALRGRPAHEFGLTDKGAGKARRLLAKAEREAAQSTGFPLMCPVDVVI